MPGCAARGALNKGALIALVKSKQNEIWGKFFRGWSQLNKRFSDEIDKLDGLEDYLK